MVLDINKIDYYLFIAMGSRDIHRVGMGYVLHQSLSITGINFTNVGGITAGFVGWAKR